MLYENQEILETINENISNPLTSINLDISPKKEKEEEKDLIEDEMLLNLYSESLDNMRKDRIEADELMSKFSDMVFNEGDASSSSKEAIVNLFKAKTDINDKITKIAELATRIKLKERDTFPKYLAAHQNNTFNIDAKRTVSSEDKKRIIEAENKKLEE